MDKDKIFDAFRNCVTEPKCRDCPWETCEKIPSIPKTRIPIDLGLAVISLMKEQDSVEHALEVLRKNGWKENRGVNSEYGESGQV